MPREIDSRRPAQSYARLYDDILDNEKMLAAGPLCFALYCAILAYCHRHETDGRIHPSRIKSLLDFSAVEVDAANPTARPFGPSSMAGDTGADPILIADALTEAGLLELQDGWYVVHDYLKHNDSHAEREAIRAKLKQGGKNGAAVRWGHGPANGHTYKESDRPADSPGHSQGLGLMDGLRMPKGEGRREKAVSNTPPFPPRAAEDGQGHGSPYSDRGISIVEWWCQKKGWQQVPPSKQAKTYGDAESLGMLDLSEEELLSLLDEVWVQADPKPETLAYFWRPAQNREHELLKVRKPANFAMASVLKDLDPNRKEAQP